MESLAERSPRAAARLLEEAFAAADSLETMSERGREVPEIRDGHTRELFVRRHRMMYEVWDQHVHIVAFVYGARDFERWRHGE
jgi:plasmid stabilization system protein ParE